MKQLLVKMRKFFSRETVLKLADEGKATLSLMAFFGLVLVLLIDVVVGFVAKIPVIKQIVARLGSKVSTHSWNVTERIINRLDSKTDRIRRSVIIQLAFRNLRAKKTRAFVTVGGMGLGVGAIVFLVSLGYGVQNLVVSRVARLDELKMADVTLQNSSTVRLDKAAVATLKQLPGVERVMPLVSLVGKLSFSGGQGETLVYGVSTAYLEAAGVKTVKGEYFDAKDETALVPTQGVVAGAYEDTYESPGSVGSEIRSGRYQIEQGVQTVYLEPWAGSTMLGLTQKIAGGVWGKEVWGEGYPGVKGNYTVSLTNARRGVWLFATYPLWEKKSGGLVPKLDEAGAQEWRAGYIKVGSVVTQGGSVLGTRVDTEPYTVLGDETEASVSATVVGRDEAGVEWVEMSSLDASASAETPQVLVIEMSGEAKRQALVNQAFMDLVGIDKNNPVGATFDVSFAILNTLKPDLDRPAESQKTKYTVAGVIDQGNNPMIYVPIGDLTGLGITNFSQAKVVASDENKLADVRRRIDTLGYKTTSVVDTVAQIDSLFATVRMVLASFGLVALTVASLGMFNTLTVSLMERTREVGVMKAMGMQSDEVKELFLAEAMIMGLLGGVFGVVAGWLMGKVLGLILTSISLAKGVGVINISLIPWQFVLFVLALSFVVGVVTGIYPARRARRISALNALRYE